MEMMFFRFLNASTYDKDRTVQIGSRKTGPNEEDTEEWYTFYFWKMPAGVVRNIAIPQAVMESFWWPMFRREEKEWGADEAMVQMVERFYLPQVLEEARICSIKHWDKRIEEVYNP